MTAQIVTEIAAGIMTLRINRPEKRNAVTTAMWTAIASALNAADKDPAVRVAVLSGAGDNFTAGNDLKDFLDNPLTTLDAPAYQFMRALIGFTKPVVVAVRGVAIGVGTTTLLHCDLAYAAPDARFQLPFVNLALAPEFASSLTLPRLVGQARAAEMLMLGEPFTAEAALSAGLINAIVPATELMTVAMAKAKALAAKPPAALRATKALLRSSSKDILDAIGREAVIYRDCMDSAEMKEAIAAFFEKRPADFSRFS